jgi:2-dehydro-3-deoxygalactonokinase
VHVLKELISSFGVKALYSEWQQHGGDREFIFLHFLKQQIEQLGVNIPEDIEIVISGMASSNIGIRELPYASLPFNIDGKGLYVELIKHSLFPRGFQLISGVCSDSDVIRGEETQMIGLAGKEDLNRKSIFILPGTHSKHIVCENGKITRFNTFMTGELFQVISTHTILKSSVEKPTPGFNDWKAFDDGVRINRDDLSILNSLFKIRTRDILHKKSSMENYYYLSGILIGEEMASLSSISCDKIILCAGNHLYEFYQRAIQVLELCDRTVEIDEKNFEDSIIKGQLMILKQNNGS